MNRNCNSLCLSDGDDLQILDNLSPDDRWQENELIPIPVPCNPATNNGLHYRLVCHSILRETKNYGPLYEPDSAYIFSEQKKTQEKFTCDNPLTGNYLTEQIHPDINSVKTSNAENMQVTPVNKFEKMKEQPNSNYPYNKQNSKVRDLRELLNERRQTRDDSESSSILQQELNPEDMLGNGEIIYDEPSAWPDMELLRLMKNIAFVDLDNLPGFFNKLTYAFPSRTFVWVFHGGRSDFKPPKCSIFYEKLMAENCIYLHPQCGRTKDAADFAICTTAGMLDANLPKNIPFIVISGDKGFEELGRQLLLRGRTVYVVDPHIQEGIDSIYRILGVY